MNFRRCVFFSALLLARPTQTTSHQVIVLETFGAGAGPAAVLVHHADAATRNQFAHWLQTHPTMAIRVRNKAGEEVAGTIFRVRACFGRGLILLEKPSQIRERDTLSVIAPGG